jgi:putative tryptophan/tyrosine transport system substrate-binding protein
MSPASHRRDLIWPANASNSCANSRPVAADWQYLSTSVIQRPKKSLARALGLESAVLEIRRTEDIAPAFDGAKGRADALYVVGEALVTANAVLITKLALDAGLPAISNYREFAASGGLMAYGPNFPALFQRAADVVDKILRGAKPADIPVQQPTKFDLVINLKSGKALGLTMPQTLLATADEVIE